MALGTQAQGKLLDYEQFIDHQLARTQAKIKTTDILIGDVSVGIDDLHASLQKYSPGFGSTGLSSETLPPSEAPTVCC